MNLLHDAYAAWLSGITYKTGNEIYWVDEHGRSITVELVNADKVRYIVRRYYENGNKHWEDECQNDQRHGKSIGWYKNGNKHWEAEYQNDQLIRKIL